MQFNEMLVPLIAQCLKDFDRVGCDESSNVVSVRGDGKGWSAKLSSAQWTRITDLGGGIDVY